MRTWTLKYSGSDGICTVQAPWGAEQRMPVEEFHGIIGTSALLRRWLRRATDQAGRAVRLVFGDQLLPAG